MHDPFGLAPFLHCRDILSSGYHQCHADHIAAVRPALISNSHVAALAPRSAFDAASSTVPPSPSLSPCAPPLFLWLPAVGLACSAPELEAGPVKGEEEAADPTSTPDLEGAVLDTRTTEVVADEVEGTVDVDRIEEAVVVVSISEVINVTWIEI